MPSTYSLKKNVFFFLSFFFGFWVDLKFPTLFLFLITFPPYLINERPHYAGSVWSLHSLFCLCATQIRDSDICSLKIRQSDICSPKRYLVLIKKKKKSIL